MQGANPVAGQRHAAEAMLEQHAHRGLPDQLREQRPQRGLAVVGAAAEQEVAFHHGARAAAHFIGVAAVAQHADAAAHEPTEPPGRLHEHHAPGRGRHGQRRHHPGSGAAVHADVGAQAGPGRAGCTGCTGFIR